MKKIISFFAAAALMTGWLNAQQRSATNSDFATRLRETVNTAKGQEPEPLTRFDLDFPGGTPGELVKAIEKASGHPLNAIIQPEYAKTEMPPLKMKSVTVRELFNAVGAATQKTTNHRLSNGGYTQVAVSYGFTTAGEAREESIWYFFHTTPPASVEMGPPNACRFFQLEPFLADYKVEDITTAIETGWKMLGFGRGPTFAPDMTAPEISYHKDTKLLIAVGDPEKLKLIDSVLGQLVKPEKNSMEAVLRSIQQISQPSVPLPSTRGATNKN